MKKIKVLLHFFLLLGCSEAEQPKIKNTSNDNLVIINDSAVAEKSNKAVINHLQFSIKIKADKEKIWDALWDDKNYRDWSSIFGEGSHYKTDSWKEGNEIMFLSSDQSGIYSIIESHVPNEIITFKHIGTVIQGIKQPIDEETKKWSGAKEIYSLKKGPGFHTLIVEIDVLDEHLEFMSTKLPLALEKIKSNCK